MKGGASGNRDFAMFWLGDRFALLVQSCPQPPEMLMDSTSPPPQYSSRLDLALLFIRVASALVFLYHGAAILFGTFGGPGPAKFAAFMHAPVVIGYLVGLAQFAGGLALLTGILFRLGAVCILIVMVGAIFLVHLSRGFDIAKGGMEYALTQLLLVFALLLTGPGAYSLNHLLPQPVRKL
jgi:putative oxidoreductase